MSDFHVGDTVYIRSIGTVDRILTLCTLQTGDGRSRLLGYEMDVLSGIWQSDDLELVYGGCIRETVRKYKAGRDSGED